MEEREELIFLYEYYGSLLTITQQDYFYDYYYDNLTMEEISCNRGVSKNAISKQLIGIKEKLYYYESKLHLKYNNDKLNEILDKDTLLKIDKYI